MRIKRVLGQNFLKDRKTAKKLAEALRAKKGDTVIEIGPGHGALTEFLIATGAAVFGVEKDAELCRELAKKFSGKKNFTLLCGDALDVKFSVMSRRRPWKLIGNIPYGLTGKILRKLTEESLKPDSVVLTLQKEVAQRLLAKPPSATLLSNIVGFFYGVKKITFIPRKVFFPQPKVDSTAIRLTRIANSKGQTGKKIITILKVGFKQPRKTLLNNLSEAYPREQARRAIANLGFSDTIRAENLNPEDWKKLSNVLEN